MSLCVLSLPEAFETQMRIPRSLEPLITPKTFFLLNKSDLAAASTADLPAVMGGKAWPVSLSTGEGTKEFLDNFSRALQKRCVWLYFVFPIQRLLHFRYDLSEDQDSSQAPLVTHARHRTHLESALQFLEAFLETCKSNFFSSKVRLVWTILSSSRGYRSRRRRAALCSASHWEGIRID